MEQQTLSTVVACMWAHITRVFGMKAEVGVSQLSGVTGSFAVGSVRGVGREMAELRGRASSHIVERPQTASGSAKLLLPGLPGGELNVSPQLH